MRKLEWEMGSLDCGMAEQEQSMVVILMGVSGVGKTTVGMRLAHALDWDFADADEFHPDSNIEKMSRGEALTDADRWPWLRAIRDFVRDRLANDESAVVTCSALKGAYRDVLLVGNDEAKLVYLRGSYDLIQRRLESREDHFFDADLLDSQFEALEEPAADEALIVDVNGSPDDVVHTILSELPGVCASSE